ncbi:type 4a pilus biogenesis protein PilO [Halomonas sediminis]|uniref:Type 4a pilus biogenesis protein PilO n=1 Tax=Vreelandella zhuhanensis TaxID=2684210 RepID=A0A7X3GYS0_9GAMM|nr:type 4a pilus biogenesis protein PilO [Halomonas zhuhanensis]MWJ27199.1 type 4a pilus biogenesis protein PilO [Halomonas zhuhanensis]
MNLNAQWERLAEEGRRLKNTDWRELDVKEAGSWPLLLKILCCVLGLVVALAAMDWFVISERRDTLESAQRREASLLDDYRMKAAEASHLPEMQEQLMSLETQMQRLRDMLPTTAEVPSLLDSISDAAIDNRLMIDAIRLRSSIARTHYVEQPFDIQVRGGYHQIANFIADMAALPRIVTQHDFTLEPVARQGDQSQGDELRLSMLARTYNYRAEEKAE